MPNISIKTTILLTFLSLVIILAISLLYSQYHFSKELAMNSTHRTFKIISNNIRKHLHQEDLSTQNILKIKSKHKDILEPITTNPFHPVLKSFIQILQRKNNLSSIYMINSDGDFYEVVNLNNRKNLRQIMKAPEDSTWIVITIINSKRQKIFLDRELNIIEKRDSIIKFNLLNRSWYKRALTSNDIVTTLPYQFSNTKDIGITYSKEIGKTGVVIAVDYTMKELNNILALQKYDEKSEIFILDEKYNKFASSSFVNQSKNSKLDSTLKRVWLDNKMKKIMHYSTKDGNFFAIINQLANNKAYLGITIDADKLLKPYRDSLEYSMYIALILISVSIIIILISTNYIVRPIKRLILENEKIKNRNFNEVKEIKTNIIEFRDLSQSLLSMSKSIQEYQKAQEEMLDSIIKLIAEAIDAKSPYTGGHCERVPEIAQLLLNEVNNSNEEEFKSFHLSSKDDLREFEIGAWLHDCGKVTTPEYVVDKSTKLETIYNRIHEIRMRFEVLWRDAELEYMKKLLNNQDESSAKEALHVRQNKLLDDYSFIASVNVGGEYMDESKQQRVKDIASIQWQRHFDDRIGLGEIEILRYKDEPIQELPATEKLLADKKIHIIKRENFDYEGYKKDGFKEDVPKYLYNYGEIYNLCIAKGTLSTEERYKINEHVIMSIKMLEKIPFPPHLKNIPEYAGTHHENLIGTGYPRKFTKVELSIPARIMAIADIFEALTASDRPYKKAKTLSQSLKIMSFMAKDQHIDKELFKLFLESGIYKQYAQKYLKNEQIDDVDIKTLIHL